MLLKIVVKFILYSLAIFIYLSTGFIKERFGVPTIDQIIFQLLLARKSINGIPDDLINSYIETIKGVFPFLLFITSFEFLLFLVKKFIKPTKSIFSIILLKLDQLLLSKLAIGLFISSIIYFCYSFMFHQYVYEQLKQEFLYQNYVNPEEVEIQPRELKNLVLIYMESMEDTFSNKSIFGRNLLQSIDDIQAIKFAKYKQTLGTQWTIAGQFATQCGIPININYVNYNNLCLTDILAKYGYYNIYLQGTSLDFTNKREFFQNHNIHKIYGKEEWADQGIKVMNWGAYDDDIFAAAKKLIKKMHNDHKLFNLTILTGDTHYPGYPSPSCNINESNVIPKTVECSANQVADFINFIINNDYLKDTNIVIIGDHLFHIDSTVNNIPKFKRYIFNRFISADHHQPNREEILHMDMFPSILTFIGFKVEGERLGLGKSGF